MKRAALITLLLPLWGCAAAKLVMAPLPAPPPNRGATIVVLEPFFEEAGWQTSTRTERVMGYPGYGYGRFGSPYYGAGPVPLEVTREVVSKPATSSVPSLFSEHELVLREVQRLRPNWQVVSTAAVQSLSGPVQLIRTIIADQTVSESDRTLKDLACGLGLGIPALFISIHETQRVQGGMIKYEADAEGLRTHLLRYATQPDFAVDTRTLPQPVTQPFALEVSYEEGVFGPDAARDHAIVQGFSQSLAVAIVAFVEGIKPP